MIDPTKKYRLRDEMAGEVLQVVISKNPAANRTPVMVEVRWESDGRAGWVPYYADGQFSSYLEAPHNYDLVEVTPFADFKIDDPVFVSDDRINWHQRHFAGVIENGVPTTWSQGKTSFSSNGTGQRTGWEFCVKDDPRKAK
jgi:hypothetical protein